MKRNLISVVLFFVLVLSSCITITSVHMKGDHMKGIKRVAVEFDYSQTRVGKYSEEEYVNEKVTEKNEDDAGDGDDWKKKWDAQKEEAFAPEFIRSLSVKLQSKGIEVGKDIANPDAKIVVYVKKIEPGYNVGIMKRDAYIDIEAKTFRTANPDQPIDVFTKERIIGADSFDVRKRLSYSFRQAGMFLGKHLMR